MARRKSFTSLLTQIAREQARNAREEERQALAEQRKLEQVNREMMRQNAQRDKDAKLYYVNSQIVETQIKNQRLEKQIDELNHILEMCLIGNSTINFNDLRVKDTLREFQLPPDLQDLSQAPSLQDYLSPVKKPTGLEKLIPGAENRYQKSLSEANIRFLEAQQVSKKLSEERTVRIQKLREEYEKEKQEFELSTQNRNNEIEEFEQAYHNGDPEAIVTYNAMVLEGSSYPDGFPQEFRIAYVAESKEIVVEYELPDTSIVPKISEYRYNKTKDTIDEKQRKQTEVKEQYQNIVASVCLRSLHEVIEADQGNHILVVAFNGFVQTVDPSTGRDVRPCLISTRTTKERFKEINLERIDKRACLRNLGAQISSRPEEMIAVKPIVDFDMVDKRYVEQSDVLSELDSRPNLMELSPFEFETMVSNLFEKIGFQAKLTRSSKDGGVDAVAYDPRPILGGKVVIQAKRYKNVVGVSAVRDLYGTMINEGANKGILVTTSHYGPDAYEFAKDKPIELIDGGGLLYLLEQQGIKARIIMPEDN